MMYYRLDGSGPRRTKGPDWDTTCRRVAGWRVTIDTGPGWRKMLVIDRETRRHYVRTEAPSGSTLTQIDKVVAAGLYRTRALATELFPVLA